MGKAMRPLGNALLAGAAILAIGLPYMDCRARLTILRREIAETRPVVYILPHKAPRQWKPGDPLPRIPGYNAPEVTHVR